MADGFYGRVGEECTEVVHQTAFALGRMHSAEQMTHFVCHDPLICFCITVTLLVGIVSSAEGGET